MNVLPFHRFEITSQLKRQDAMAALAARLEPWRMFRARWPNSSNDRRFEGTVHDDGFVVQRVLGYNNAFAPVSTGEVKAAGAGSQIQVRMQPHPLALTLFGAVLLLGIIGMVMGDGEVWMAVVLGAMLYIMVSCGFWLEAERQERTLREIFRAL